jgi:hypothetical protein
MLAYSSSPSPSPNIHFVPAISSSNAYLGNHPSRLFQVYKSTYEDIEKVQAVLIPRGLHSVISRILTLYIHFHTRIRRGTPISFIMIERPYFQAKLPAALMHKALCGGVIWQPAYNLQGCLIFMGMSRIDLSRFSRTSKDLPGNHG